MWLWTMPIERTALQPSFFSDAGAGSETYSRVSSRPCLLDFVRLVPSASRRRSVRLEVFDQRLLQKTQVVSIPKDGINC